MKRIFCVLLALVITSSTFAQDDYKKWVQRQNIPSWVSKLFTSKKLSVTYDFSFHLNPFYLRGDFNGDNKPDIAILIREHKSTKLGIAVLHFETNEVFILGAGKAIENGGDDFRWMDIWFVYREGKVYQGTDEITIPTLKGEALFVEKSESASGLIYWDGEKYVWYQQGD